MINTADEYFIDKKLNITNQLLTNQLLTNTEDIMIKPEIYKTDDLHLLNSAIRCLF